MAGRPPKPKAILQLSDPAAARRRKEIGIPPKHLPLVPPHLNASASDIFLNTCELLHGLGVMAVSDVEVIGRYSIVLDLNHQAAVEMNDDPEKVVPIHDQQTGELRFTRNAPAWELFLQTSEQLKKLEAVLGLSPVDRTRLGIARSNTQAKPGDSFEELLG